MCVGKIDVDKLTFTCEYRRSVESDEILFSVIHKCNNRLNEVI